MAWSFSAIKTFVQCPEKYNRTRVAKDVEDTPGVAAHYGTDAHEAAEYFIKSDTPLPPHFQYMAPTLLKLKAMRGDKHTELGMGVRKTNDGYEAADFADPEAWYRGIADIVVDDHERRKGFIGDYKTSKNARFADVKQLDLLAGAAFLRFPHMERIRAALIFVVSREVVAKTYTRADLHKCLSVFSFDLERLEMAKESGVWNANPSGLCGWCPVLTCPHNTKR